MYAITLKQMVDPTMLRMWFVEKLTCLETYDFEAGIIQQML